MGHDICAFIILNCILSAAQADLNNNVEHKVQIKNSEKYNQEAKEAHNVFLYHGVASLEHSNQSAVYKKSQEELSKEISSHNKHVAIYDNKLKTEKDSKQIGHYKKLLENTKALVKNHLEMISLHRKLVETQDKLAENNLEVAKHSAQLRNVAKDASNIHKKIADTHMELYQMQNSSK